MVSGSLALSNSIVRDAATITSLIAEAVPTPPGADGLVFLPYLAGERSPLWDPTARGAFAGLRACGRMVFVGVS